MAKPDCDDGWFKLAYELLPAILLGGFRVEASIVVCEVLAQTYGRGKRNSAVIEPVKIAARSGRKRSNIWRGIKELCEANVIERTPNGEYRFRKDYAKWRDGETPRINADLRRYCAVYPELAKAFEPDDAPKLSVSQVDTVSADTDGSVSQVDTLETPVKSANADIVSQVDTPSVTFDKTSVSQADTLSVSQVDTQTGIPPTPPLVGVRIREVVAQSAATSPEAEGKNPGAASNPPALEIPPCPTDDQVMCPPMSGNHRPTRAEVEQCWTAIWKCFGTTAADKKRLANAYYEQQQYYSHDAWIEALREMYRRGTTNFRSIGYVGQLAAEYDAKGLPERKAMPTGRDVVPFARTEPDPDRFHKRTRDPIKFVPSRKVGM